MRGQGGPARDFTRSTIGHWHVPGLYDDAAVVISELGDERRAVRFAGRACQVRSGRAAGARSDVHAACLVCAVTDPNPGPPLLMEPHFAAETGRGLCVVESLSKQWGWTPLSTDRKAAWAALALRQRPRH